MIVSLIQEPFRFGLETLVEQPPRVTVYHHNHASPPPTRRASPPDLRASASRSSPTPPGSMVSSIQA